MYKEGLQEQLRASNAHAICDVAVERMNRGACDASLPQTQPAPPLRPLYLAMLDLWWAAPVEHAPPSDRMLNTNAHFEPDILARCISYVTHLTDTRDSAHSHRGACTHAHMCGCAWQHAADKKGLSSVVREKTGSAAAYGQAACYKTLPFIPR